MCRDTDCAWPCLRRAAEREDSGCERAALIPLYSEQQHSRFDTHAECRSRTLVHVGLVLPDSHSCTHWCDPGLIHVFHTASILLRDGRRICFGSGSHGIHSVWFSKGGQARGSEGGGD